MDLNVIMLLWNFFSFCENIYVVVQSNKLVDGYSKVLFYREKMFRKMGNEYFVKVVKYYLNNFLSLDFHQYRV